MGSIEGAVADLEAALRDGLLDLQESMEDMDRVVAVARLHLRVLQFSAAPPPPRLWTGVCGPSATPS
jgi:hypothetical protein